MTRSLIDGKAIPVIEHREAACLRKIECTPEDNQQISPAAQEAVYAAWDLALDSISRQWDFYIDPRNTAPKISRINSKAAELIRDNLGAEDNDLSKEDKEKALRIVLSPWTTRDERASYLGQFYGRRLYQPFET